MAKQTVQVEGLRETLRACNALGKDANRELRAATKEIAQATAHRAASRATALGGVAALVAPSLRAGSDRVPLIRGGGAKRVGQRRAPAGAMFFGAEFGGRRRPTTQQFRPHLGQQGYFLWPTIRERKHADLARYQHALDATCRKWGRGG